MGVFNKIKATFQESREFLTKGILTIETSVGLSWNNFKLQNLFQIMNLK
jgi:hypothetical protein